MHLFIGLTMSAIRDDNEMDGDDLIRKEARDESKRRGREHP